MSSDHRLIHELSSRDVTGDDAQRVAQAIETLQSASDDFSDTIFAWLDSKDASVATRAEAHKDAQAILEAVTQAVASLAPPAIDETKPEFTGLSREDFNRVVELARMAGFEQGYVDTVRSSLSHIVPPAKVLQENILNDGADKFLMTFGYPKRENFLLSNPGAIQKYQDEAANIVEEYIEQYKDGVRTAVTTKTPFL